MSTTATMVDTTDIDFQLLSDEILDHWIRCGARADRALRGQAHATVRAVLAGISAQGLRVLPGHGGTEAVNLVLLARYLYNTRPHVEAAGVAAAFGAARQDAYIAVRALACQDRQVVAA